MDLKPENVLIQLDSIKLTDFGVAIPMESPRHILSAHMGGTKAYWPPELLARDIQFDSTVNDFFKIFTVSLSN
jgi:serine/threonine protein kinase